MKKYDVIIVGAGPAGLYTAKLLEKKLDVVVVEEHKKIGFPVQCSGLISRNLENLMEINKVFVEHRVKSALLHSPFGTELKLEKAKTAAYVINRGKFDCFLAKSLKSRVLLGTKAKSISVKNRVRVSTNMGDFESEFLVGCDGANSLVAREFNARPQEILTGLIALVKKQDRSANVDLWFDKNITDGFLWKIPRGEKTEYGMLGKKVGFGVLEKFFGLKNYEKVTGLVPIGPGKTYFDRTILIGDAAAQIKPWSGGGVVYGLTCAKIASSVILDSFKEGDFSETFLKRYEDGWKKSIGKNISLGLMFREFYKEMNNRDIERIFRKLREKKTGFSFLDMDFPVENMFKY